MAARARPGCRRIIDALRASCVVLGIALLICSGIPAAAGTITIVPEHRSARAGSACYSVAATGGAMIVVIDGDVTQASLSGGAGLEQVGSRVTYGSVPLGHGLPSFRLEPSSVTRRLCIEGRNLHLAALADDKTLREALAASRLSGLYAGIIFAIIILQMMLVSVTRERAAACYLLFLITLLGVESVREGLTILPNLSLAAAYVFWDSACGFAITAFLIEFLDLRRSAPRLCWIMIASVAGLVANAIAGLAIPAIGSHFAQSLLVSNAAGMVLFISISVLRFRAGYRPAYYLLAGLGGLTVQNCYLLARDWWTFSTPLVDRWAFEASSALDAMLFLLAIVLRMRDNRREQQRVERELLDATFAADHDQLTRLRNRRGLERWIEMAPLAARTVFFIDLDNFKQVNDRGGHQAGASPSSPWRRSSMG